MKTSLRRSEIFLPASSTGTVFFWNFFLLHYLPMSNNSASLSRAASWQAPASVAQDLWQKQSGKHSRVINSQEFFLLDFHCRIIQENPSSAGDNCPWKSHCCFILSWRMIWTSSSPLPSPKGQSGHFPHLAMFLGYRAPLAFPTSFSRYRMAAVQIPEKWVHREAVLHFLWVLTLISLLLFLIWGLTALITDWYFQQLLSSIHLVLCRKTEK